MKLILVFFTLETCIWIEIVCQMIDSLFMFIILTYQYNTPDIAGS